MEMRFYMRIIRKGWWLILIAVLVAVNFSLVYSYYLTRPTYEAVARFIVSPNIQNIESRDLVNSLEALDKRSIISTYAEVLNSREIITKTLNLLGMDQVQYDAYTAYVTVLPDANIIRFSVQGPNHK
jgi:capsular polysaccharide biosynthesis protein